MAFRATFREYWYITGLYSEDEERRVHCADELGAMKSLRAVPHLIDRIREDELEPATAKVHGIFNGRLDVHLTPFIYALYLIGPEALPDLSQLLAGEDQRRIKSIPELLKVAWSRPEKVVHRMSYAQGEDFLRTGYRARSFK